MILALESSCDETAAAVLEPPMKLLSSEVASQVNKHRPFGGVVPELASRNHLLSLRPVIEGALQGAAVCLNQVEAFAATAGPGLASSLLMGNTTAKALAVTCARPFISVNHMEGHLLSPFLNAPLRPHLALIVSGGHTLLVKVNEFGNYEKLGSSRDDAAGEAFDKVGKMLGLPYPGGPEVEQCAKDGDCQRFSFPRSMIDSGDFSFSFSGLKTAVLYTLQKIGTPDPQTLADLCASFQAAVVDVLVAKALSAARHCQVGTIALSGGVACNLSLRKGLQTACEKNSLELCTVTLEHSTDNAAMIARAAAEKLARGQFTELSEDIDPNLSLAP